MDRPAAQKRPWLAAALALPVTGLGHVYLRRWRRALGWLLVVTAATALFVPPEALENPAALTGIPFWDTAPLFLIVGLSAVDAYLLARHQNVVSEIRTARRCSDCYRELTADVAFCAWCGTELPDTDEHEHRRR